MPKSSENCVASGRAFHAAARNVFVGQIGAQFSTSQKRLATTRRLAVLLLRSEWNDLVLTHYYVL